MCLFAHEKCARTCINLGFLKQKQNYHLPSLFLVKLPPTQPVCISEEEEEKRQHTAPPPGACHHGQQVISYSAPLLDTAQAPATAVPVTPASQPQPLPEQKKYAAGGMRAGSPQSLPPPTLHPAVKVPPASLATMCDLLNPASGQRKRVGA